MGPAAARRYSLSLSVRFSVRATYGYEYPQATKGSIEISPFYGTESEQFAKHWIYNYEAWTIQELLDGRQKLQIVLLALFDKAYEWAHNLKFSEHGTWKDFRSLFQERFVGDPTPWSGEIWAICGKFIIGDLIINPKKNSQTKKQSHGMLGMFCFRESD